MDSDKFQDLMMDQFGKLFNEIQTFKQDVKSEFSDVKSEFSDVKSRLSKLETRLTSVEQSQVRLETNLTKKIDVLYFDFPETQKQRNAEIMDEIKKLNTKVEALQMESTLHDNDIRILKGVSG